MLDFRRKQEYILGEKYGIKGNIYIFYYKKNNIISYGINGTSLHYALLNYKDKTKEDIIKEIINTLIKDGVERCYI